MTGRELVYTASDPDVVAWLESLYDDIQQQRADHPDQQGLAYLTWEQAVYPHAVVKTRGAPTPPPTPTDDTDGYASWA